MKTSILFVCLGNICRSPTAEGVARALAPRFSSIGRIDSAATTDWNVGRSPDSRTTKAAAQRGYDLSAQRARQVERSDFDQFDLIVAMDEENLAALRAMSPENSRAKVAMLGEWLPGRPAVPDPYYGGAEGFETVLDLLESGVVALFTAVERGDIHR